MILYPTLELRGDAGMDGLQPDLQQQADSLYRIGFRQFYFIDRKAQFEDQPFGLAQVQVLLALYPDCEIWIGGGLKDLQTIEALAVTTAARIVVGPMLWRQPGLFADAVQRLPGRLLALIAARQGWIDQAGSSARIRALDQALMLEDEGASGIIYLERERAGFYGGIEAETMADLAFALRVPLYVTGAIDTLAAVRALKEHASTGLSGLIVGQALLDGRIDPVSALTLLAQKD